MNGSSLIRALTAASLSASLFGCASLEAVYRPAEPAPLQGPVTATEDTSCDRPDDPAAPPPPYTLRYLKDCTSSDSLIMFAFSGGGIRSAAFGYGVLTAAHGMQIPDASGTTHPFTRDIDIVSGVSGGSFTAAAFATHREDLFPAPGAPDHYRDKFLTHQFFHDLASIYLAPWHWQWMLPSYSTQDEMAKIYAGIEFSSRTDKVFAPSFGDLARKGRPLLVVQATDYGNEQPFTFTQNDFDLLCSDLSTYPVGNAVAASSAFPVLFSPIRLTNHHLADPPAGSYCASHRPDWVDQVLQSPEPEDLSRGYARAQIADTYLPPAPGKPRKARSGAGAYVFLQDGGVTDNVGLRGMTNVILHHLGGNGAEQSRATACRAGWGKVKRVVVVAVDAQAKPNNQIGALPYLSDLTMVMQVTSSAMIDANGFETLLATDALTKQIAAQLSKLSCDGAPHEVSATLARVSFNDLAEATVLDGTACGLKAGESCTMGDLARSKTSLDFPGGQVDALIAAGRSAFLCNRKIVRLQADLDAAVSASAPYSCRGEVAH